MSWSYKSHTHIGTSPSGMLCYLFILERTDFKQARIEMSTTNALDESKVLELASEYCSVHNKFDPLPSTEEQ